tara:strand:+ start:4762 stop:5046 length:285 start_codon:yes stop_codon:yes gene_type:complete
MEHKIVVRYGLAILIIETILMGLWFYIENPELKAALNVLKIVLILAGINLVLALISYFLKKSFTVLFVANAIITPVIFYALWIMWFTYYAPYPS